MKMKSVLMMALCTTLAVAPLAPAQAHGGFDGHHGGRNLGIFALGAAIVGATAVVLSAPFNAIAEAGPAAAPYPQQAYYPQPYYAQPQPYYAPQAYYPAPVYYAPRPYYAPRGYYRY